MIVFCSARSATGPARSNKKNDHLFLPIPYAKHKLRSDLCGIVEGTLMTDTVIVYHKGNEMARGQTTRCDRVLYQEKTYEKVSHFYDEIVFAVDPHHLELVMSQTTASRTLVAQTLKANSTFNC